MDVAIIGAGIIGLMSGLTLTEAGFNVVIIARDLPGHDNQDWASHWYSSFLEMGYCLSNANCRRAGAAILPYPDAAGQDLQAKSFKYYWELAQKDQNSGTQVSFLLQVLDKAR